MLSVVIPSYNEEKMINRTSKVISRILENEGIDYELIFIDDGSKDQTWDEIKKAFLQNANIKGISFSRNFGKESAIFAGLSASKGNCAVVIDCDLQHPPEKIIEMYHLWENGYEIVEGVKSDRGKESILHRFAVKCFYEIISKASGIDMLNASDYKLVDRKVINALLNMTEKNAFFRALSSWVGFKTIQVNYNVQERQMGESKWSTKLLIKYALMNITSFTSIPLYISIFLGIIMVITGVVLSIEILVRKNLEDLIKGCMIIAILQCFFGGAIMVSLGILGYYISKIFEGMQNRPRYIISEKVGHDNY